MSDIEKFVVIEEPLTCKLSVKMDGTTLFHLESNMVDLYNNIVNKEYDNGKLMTPELDAKLQRAFDEKYHESVSLNDEFTVSPIVVLQNFHHLCSDTLPKVQIQQRFQDLAVDTSELNETILYQTDENVINSEHVNIDLCKNDRPLVRYKYFYKVMVEIPYSTYDFYLSLKNALGLQKRILAIYFKYDNSNEFGLKEIIDHIEPNKYIPDALDYRVHDYFYIQYGSYFSRHGGVSTQHGKMPLTQYVIEIQSTIKTIGTIGGTVGLILTITRFFNGYVLSKKFKTALNKDLLLIEQDKGIADHKISKESEIEVLFSYEGLHEMKL